MIDIKLLNILDEKDRNLNWLSNNAGINYSTLYNFAHQKTSSVTYDILERLCKTLRCKVQDIIEYVPIGIDILPESELEILENAVSVIVDKTNRKERVSHNEMIFLRDLFLNSINHHQNYNNYELERFYKAYLISTKLLPLELSSEVLRTFIANINTDSFK